MNDNKLSIRSLSGEEMNLIGGGSGIIPIHDNPITIIINIITSIFSD